MFTSSFELQAGKSYPVFPNFSHGVSSDSSRLSHPAPPHVYYSRICCISKVKSFATVHFFLRKWGSDKRATVDYCPEAQEVQDPRRLLPCTSPAPDEVQGSNAAKPTKADNIKSEASALEPGQCLTKEAAQSEEMSSGETQKKELNGTVDGVGESRNSGKAGGRKSFIK